MTIIQEEYDGRMAAAAAQYNLHLIVYHGVALSIFLEFSYFSILLYGELISLAKARGETYDYVILLF